MFSQLDVNGLVDIFTTGEVYDEKALSITTSMVNSNMTIQEAINEQLDIIFDEVLLSRSNLSKDKALLEESLRIIGSRWKHRLEKP